MDGYEATRRIKATTKGQATVIVALTASAFEEDRETILSAGCDDVVRKPFRKEEIFDMLAKHLGVRFVYGEEEAAPTAPPLAEVQEVLTPEALAALPADWLAESTGYLAGCSVRGAGLSGRGGGTACLRPGGLDQLRL